MAFLDWIEAVPREVKIPFAVAGFLLSAFSSRLTEALQDVGLWLGLILLVGATLALCLHGIRGRFGEMSRLWGTSDAAVVRRPMTHPHDIPKKLSVIDDEIAPLVAEDGEIRRHVKQGRQLLNKWKADINTDRPSFLAKLQDYDQIQTVLLDRVAKLRQKNLHFEDIASLLDIPNSEYNFKETITKGFISFKGAIGALGDPPYKMDLDYFFTTKLQNFSSGLANLDGWRTHVEREARQLRKQIASGQG